MLKVSVSLLKTNVVIQYFDDMDEEIWFMDRAFKLLEKFEGNKKARNGWIKIWLVWNKD